jgi:predicted permease
MKLDVLTALRRLARERTSAFLVVLTLTLVGGVASVVLVVAYDVYFRPLSYPAAHELVRITGRSSDVVGTVNVSPPDFRDLRRGLASVARVAAVTPFTPQLTMTGVGEPLTVDARRISSRYFEILGIPLIAGREFVESEEQPPARSVILGERFWNAMFHDADMLGRLLTLNGEAYEVVGIVADREEVFGDADIWLPMQFPSEAIRGLRFMAVVGRLKADVTLDEAQASIDAIGVRLQREHPSTNARWQPAAASLAESVSGPLRSALALTVVVVLVLWFAACAAIGGLALSRTLQRAGELAIRKATGARTAQVLRAAIAEYVVLGFVGFIGATVLSQWVASSLRLLRLTPPAYTYDWRLTIITVFVLVAVAIGGAAAAAAVAWKGRVLGQRPSRSIARRPRTILVAAQVTIAVAVVGVAAMLLGGLIRLRSVDLAFAPNGASYVTISLPPRYATPQARARFWKQLVEQLHAIPGMRHVALTSELPLTGQQNPTAFVVRTPDGQQASIQLRSVSPYYFDAAGIAIRQGRVFSWQDDGAHPEVIVINEKLARMVFGGEDAIGERLSLNFTSPEHTAEIVGIVATVRHGGPAAPEAPEVYAPAAQTPLPRYTVLLRTDLAPQVLFSAVVREVHEADGGLAVPMPKRWSDSVEEQFTVHQTRLALAIVMAVIAVLLAALSAFGTIAEMVSMRSQEFAVRLALGAAPSSLMRTLGAELGRYIVAAIVGGLILMSTLRGWAASAMDAVALPRRWPEVSAFAIVAVAVAVASWLPTRRITRIDPADVLRT